MYIVLFLFLIDLGKFNGRVDKMIMCSGYGLYLKVC